MKDKETKEEKQIEKKEENVDKSSGKKFMGVINPVAEVKDSAATTLKLMTTALTLVAGLAWNEVIKKFVEVYVKPQFKGAGEFVGLVIYAVFITLFVVIVVNRLSKFADKVGGKSVK
ncbi:MAG TPA: hypothetical protein ENI23_02260 [bacterium]|nr:hypothetical protein [bacterium]